MRVTMSSPGFLVCNTWTVCVTRNIPGPLDSSRGLGCRRLSGRFGLATWWFPAGSVLVRIPSPRQRGRLFFTWRSMLYGGVVGSLATLLWYSSVTWLSTRKTWIWWLWFWILWMTRRRLCVCVCKQSFILGNTTALQNDIPVGKNIRDDTAIFDYFCWINNTDFTFWVLLA